MYPLERELPITLEELKVCKSSPGSRIGGAILDFIIEFAIMFTIVFIFMIITYNANPDAIMDHLITFTIMYQVISFFLNLVIPMMTKGQTIGKRAAGTRIIGIDGNIGNLVLYLVRTLFYTLIGLIGQIPALYEFASFVSFIILAICFVMLFSDEHGRTLQDRFARTIVVNDRIYKAFRERRFHEIDYPNDFMEVDEQSPNQSIEHEEDFI